jgi:hypothetical protein
MPGAHLILPLFAGLILAIEGVNSLADALAAHWQIHRHFYSYSLWWACFGWLARATLGCGAAVVSTGLIYGWQDYMVVLVGMGLPANLMLAGCGRIWHQLRSHSPAES